MPTKPLRPCLVPGCPGLTRNTNGYCDEHQEVYESKVAHRRKRFDAIRGSSTARGYDHQWQKVRKHKLVRDPLCEECRRRGVITPAEEVHHVIPIREREDLRLSLGNLESLCRRCHEATKR